MNLNIIVLSDGHCHLVLLVRDFLRLRQNKKNVKLLSFSSASNFFLSTNNKDFLICIRNFVVDHAILETNSAFWVLRSGRKMHFYKTNFQQVIKEWDSMERLSSPSPSVPPVSSSASILGSSGSGSVTELLRRSSKILEGLRNGSIIEGEDC